MGSVRKYFFEHYKVMVELLKSCTLVWLESKYDCAKHLLETVFRLEIVDVDEFNYLLSELNHVKAERLCFLYKQEKKDVIEKYGNDKELVEIYCRSYFKDLGFESIYNEMIAVEKAEAEFERVKKDDAKLFNNEDENLTFYYGYFTALSDFGIITADRCDEMTEELTALFYVDSGNAPARQELHIE